MGCLLLPCSCSARQHWMKSSWLEFGVPDTTEDVMYWDMKWSGQETFTSVTLGSIPQHPLSLCLQRAELETFTIDTNNNNNSINFICFWNFFILYTTPCTFHSCSWLHLVIQFKCLCLFLFSEIILRFTEGRLSLCHAFFSSSTSTRQGWKNIQLAANVNEDTYFSTCAFLRLLSRHQPPLSSFIVQFSARLFLSAPCNQPSHFHQPFFAHVFVYCTFSPDHPILCPFLSLETLCAFLCLFSLFAGTVCWGRAVLSVHPVWLVSGTTLNLMITI